MAVSTQDHRERTFWMGEEEEVTGRIEGIPVTVGTGGVSDTPPIPSKRSTNWSRVTLFA